MPTTIQLGGKTYRLANENPAKGDVEYSFLHWIFVVSNHQVKSVVDDLQISGNGAPVMLPQDGLLAFLGRITLSEYNEDRKARSELLTLLASESLVREAFTNTVQKLRNDYGAVATLLRCLLIGVLADPRTKQRLAQLPKQTFTALLDKLVSEAGRYFDFSSIEAFLDSFDKLPAEVVSPQI